SVGPPVPARCDSTWPGHRCSGETWPSSVWREVVTCDRVLQQEPAKPDGAVSLISNRQQTIPSKSTVIVPRRGFVPGVLDEDAPGLPDHGGMIQANVETTDEQLGVGAFQMGARVRNDPVGGAGTGRVTKVRDDRMGADRRINPQIAEAH